jgi:hypothetical protein
MPQVDFSGASPRRGSRVEQPNREYQARYKIRIYAAQSFRTKLVAWHFDGPRVLTRSKTRGRTMSRKYEPGADLDLLQSYFSRSWLPLLIPLFLQMDA